MTMLGAQLDDLEALASQLRTTAATIGDTNTDARGQTTAVVTACRDAAATTGADRDTSHQRVRRRHLVAVCHR